VFFTVIHKGETKRERERGSVPCTGAGVQRFLQAFQDKGDYREGILGCPQKLGDVLNRRQAQVDQDTGYPYESPPQPPYLDGSIARNPMHPCAGFVLFRLQVAPIGMASAVLQLLSQNHLMHPQICLL
jgi:hypothetical protein